MRKHLAIADISQLFVQEVENFVACRPQIPTTHIHSGRLDNSYQVRALLKSGKRIMLLDISHVTGKGSEARHPASIIEERIEAFLGIEDVPVDERTSTYRQFSQW